MFHSSNRLRSCLFALMLACGGLGTCQIQAQESAIDSVLIGFDGKVVLGRWVPFTVTMNRQSAAARLQVETLDGDAVPIRFEHDEEILRRGQPGDRNPAHFAGLIRLGRAAGVTVRLLDMNGGEVENRRFSLDELRESHSFLPGTTRLTLFPLGKPSSSTTEDDVTPEFDRHLSDETATVDRQNLPTNWIGYDSVRTMVITHQSREPTQAEREAIEQWVNLGGRLLITGGESFDDDFNQNVLGNLAPGDFRENVSVTDTGSIELFATTNDQLVGAGAKALPVTVIDPAPECRVEGRAGDHPLIVHWSHGFGKVTFASVDFSSEPLLSWEGRRRLLTLALEDTGVVPSTDSSTAQTGRVSHLGFTDIVGQLRAGMDQFKRVSFVTFTLVALLVGLFILAIGPGDFFFLRKVTGRMELTWITFTLICLTFCGLAWLLATQMKSSGTEVNQVEIVDVDTTTNTVRGNLWAHIYSPDTSTFDVRLPGDNRLFGKLSEGWLSWQGLPGQGIGSMQSRSDLGLYREQYKCSVTPTGSALYDVPMQNASTKALHAVWHGQVDGDLKGRLRQSPNSDALLGTVTNPLDKPLYNCVVLYGDWAYQLQDRPLEAGETIVVEDDLREKTIAGHFTRLGSRGEDEVSTAWDPRSTSLPRITQMMSFFDVIGGETYTQLTNNYHSHIDFSQQLQMGRAILTGQIRQTTTPLTINDQPFDNYDKRLTLIRMVLPVQPRQ